MTRIFLAAGVATLAISAPAVAGPHGGHGGGHAQEVRGGGHAEARAQVRAQSNNRQQARANARVEARAQARQRGNVRVAERAQAHQRAQRVRDARAQQVQRVREAQRNRVERVREARANRVDRVREARAERIDRIRNARQNQVQRIREARAERIDRIRNARQNQVERIREARADRIDRIREIRARENGRVNFADNVGYGVGGCPPGLAKKAVACMPPGQARRLLGERVAEARRLASFEKIPVRLQNIYRDTPNYYYQYGDGYAYRVNRADNVISALMPLFGAGYSVGQAFPSAYPYYGLPSAYQPFYPASSPYDYRYANGYVYQVDPYTGMIANVDPMLGYGYGYGQMMPASYSAYNVPYQYRPYYYDTSDAYYRYAPGAIYQVDPQTSLITGIAALLTGGMNVGQPMPIGYSAYNVPYDYRAQYYDTPDNWYRYANGNIYRVDPATQLVTALVASALT